MKPGRRASWPHAHSVDEEFVFVIEGNPEVWVDGEIHPLLPGDAVGFPPGTGITHTFINNTASDVRLIIVGDRGREDDRWFYALDQKGNDRARSKGRFWENHPNTTQGSHDGLPDEQRRKLGEPGK